MSNVKKMRLLHHLQKCVLSTLDQSEKADTLFVFFIFDLKVDTFLYFFF
jgi:hypothetical protein